MNKNRGLKIAVIGQDGAGKTTLTEDLYKCFKMRHAKVKLYYMGYGSGYNSFLKNIVKRNSFSRSGDPLSKLFRDISLIAFYVEVSLRCAIKTEVARLLSHMGYIVIFDRFPQIQINGIYDGPKIQSRIKNSSLFMNMLIYTVSKLETKLLNMSAQKHPDIIIKLVLPAHVSKIRKPDHSIDNINIKNEITSALQFDNSITIDIDASQSREDVLNNVCRNIADYINH